MPARAKALLVVILAIIVAGAVVASRHRDLAEDARALREQPPAVSPETVADPPPTEEPSPTPTRARSRRAAPRGPSAAPRRVVTQTRERQPVSTPVDRTARTGSGGDRGGASGGATSSGNPLRSVFPAQFGAAQTADDPATRHWALLIGIDTYQGSTPNTIGSVADAKALRSHLLSLGWRADHILFLKNKHATAANIVHAIRWLRSKATTSSVAIFHYAGHEKPVRTSADGDDESMDVALWATDNRLVIDGDLGRELGKVRHGRMWIHFATCRAGGFRDSGMRKKGRVITYSSPQHQLSYEDPEYGHSVFGYHTIALGLREGYADRDGDGQVTVEEAFAYAKPRVEKHTSDRQHPLIDDRVQGGFSLKVPPKPPEPEPSPTPTPTTCPLIVCPSAGTASYRKD